MAGKLRVGLIVCIAMFCAVNIVESAEENDELITFKKSLSVADRQLLTKMKSKTRYIEAVLAGKTEVDKRDQLDLKTASEVECCSCNPGSSGCFHPDDKKRSHVIRCCVSTDPKKSKRDEIKDKDKEVQKILDSMSPADKELMLKHKSKLKALLEASHQPAANDQEATAEVQKKQEPEEAPEEWKQVAPAAPVAAVQPAVPADLVERIREGLAELQHKLDQLAELERQPQIQPAAASADDLSEMSAKFVEDVNLAKEKGIKFDDLLAALKQRTGNRK